jgi:hypothetical protein
MKIDKKRFLIIAVAVTLFCSIYYFLLFSKTTENLQLSLSQNNLNSLVADVEYFKAQTGKYPDNLEQLKSFDPFVFITDASQSKADAYYNYKNLGDKYLLFSSGEDQLTNTSDDLYPKIRNKKTVGWIQNTTTAGNTR